DGAVTVASWPAGVELDEAIPADATACHGISRPPGEGSATADETAETSEGMVVSIVLQAVAGGFVRRPISHGRHVAPTGLRHRGATGARGSAGAREPFSGGRVRCGEATFAAARRDGSRNKGKRKRRP